MNNCKIIDETQENSIDYLLKQNIYVIKLCDYDEYKVDNYTFKNIYTTLDRPFYLDYNHFLYINLEYFKNNKEYVEYLLCQIISKCVPGKETDIFNNFVIHDIDLVTPKVKEVINNNKNIHKYQLGDIEYVKNDEEKSLIAGCSINYLKNNDQIFVYNDLSEDELNNIKYLDKYHIICLYNDSIYQVDKVINALKKNNLNCRIVLELLSDNFNNQSFGNKLVFEKYYNFVLNHNFDYDNIYIRNNSNEHKLDYYKKCEIKLSEYVNKTKGLSELEKFLYLYNVVAKYKKYKENPNDLSSSRDVYSLLFNEYMVCLGFASFLTLLCKRVGINATVIDTCCDISYDGVSLASVPQVETTRINTVGHARVCVNIHDDKYGIDGIYVSDPTWDNYLDTDIFIHSLITQKQVNMERRYFYENMWQLLLSASDMNEFIDMYNVVKRNYEYNESFMIDQLIHFFEEVDPEFYKQLLVKYPIIIKGVNYSDDKKYVSLVNDLALYIINNNDSKKEISGKTIMSAVYEMFKNTTNVSSSELDKRMNDSVDANYLRYMYSFPTRYNIKEDGTKEVYVSSPNIYDFYDDDIKKK